MGLIPSSVTFQTVSRVLAVTGDARSGFAGLVRHRGRLKRVGWGQGCQRKMSFVGLMPHMAPSLPAETTFSLPGLTSQASFTNE